MQVTFLCGNFWFLKPLNICNRDSNVDPRLFPTRWFPHLFATMKFPTIYLRCVLLTWGDFFNTHTVVQIWCNLTIYPKAFVLALTNISLHTWLWIPLQLTQTPQKWQLLRPAGGSGGLTTKLNLYITSNINLLAYIINSKVVH